MGIKDSISTAITLLLMLGLHFVAISYPYVGLGIYIMLSGLVVYSFSTEVEGDSLNKNLQNLLNDSITTSNKMLETIKSASAHIDYLNLVGSLLLNRVMKENPNISANEVMEDIDKELRSAIKEMYENSDKDKVHASDGNATG